jgi:membrane associated rhomboid family serine protease
VFLPLGDEPNDHRVRPFVNWALIAANVVVFLWAKGATQGELGYGLWVLDWGYIPLAPRVETFFTSMFMHGDLLHLAGNMLFLWIFGDNVEGRLGHLGYLLAYLASGLGAVLLFHLLSPGSDVPLVGASGAIFGVEGFYFLAFPANRVRILFWFVVAGVTMVPARLVLGLSFVWNLFLSMGTRGGQGGVAYAAHVGGFVVGFLTALASRRHRAALEDPEAAWGVPRFRR